MELAVFLIAGFIALSSAILVFTQKSPVASVVFLIVTLAAQAVLFLLLAAPFVAALQIIVYAGAIMVLFLFVVMLLNLGRDEFGPEKRKFIRPLAVIFALVLVLEVLAIFKTGLVEGARLTNHPDFAGDFGTVAGVGLLLFTRYLYPFEITSILLLAALVGTVILAKKLPGRKGEL